MRKQVKPIKTNIMKNNYNIWITMVSILMMSAVAHAQTVKLAIINAANTNDGTNDYYEADVTIETFDGQEDFKLGSGQLYFNYNTDAFGVNISANDRFEVTADENSYILGQISGFTDFYNISFINDNTDFRVSWAFDQNVSSGAMDQLVTSTPKLMIHIKIEYVDVTQDPMLVFEADEDVVVSCRDQFFTACGPFDTASTNLDCSDSVDSQNVNIQFLDAILDSSQATLSVESPKGIASEIVIYPNPTSSMIYVKTKHIINAIEFYDILGKRVLISKSRTEVDVSHLNSGVYFMKIKSDGGNITKKIVVE